MPMLVSSPKHFPLLSCQYFKRSNVLTTSCKSSKILGTAIVEICDRNGTLRHSSDDGQYHAAKPVDHFPSEIHSSAAMP